jgi:hypothetical protein
MLVQIHQPTTKQPKKQCIPEIKLKNKCKKLVVHRKTPTTTTRITVEIEPY